MKFQVFQVQFWPFSGIFWRFKAFFRVLCSVILYSYLCIVQCLLSKLKWPKTLHLTVLRTRPSIMYYTIKNVKSSKFNELIIILWFLIFFLFRESHFATLKVRENRVYKFSRCLTEIPAFFQAFPGLTNSRFIPGFQDFPGCWEHCNWSVLYLYRWKQSCGDLLVSWRRLFTGSGGSAAFPKIKKLQTPLTFFAIRNIHFLRSSARWWTSESTLVAAAMCRTMTMIRLSVHRYCLHWQLTPAIRLRWLVRMSALLVPPTT